MVYTMSLPAMFALLFFLFLQQALGANNPCVPIDFGKGSVVCVCNATYCDGVETPSPAPAGQILMYTSTKSGDRLRLDVTAFGENTCAPSDDSSISITINRADTYQKVEGFGGAFTDATGYNLFNLSEGTRNNVLRSYFDHVNGIGYNMGRLPMGGADFSTRPYTYQDKKPGTFNLYNYLLSLLGLYKEPEPEFSLQPEDYNWKIPLIKSAQNIIKETGGQDLRLCASPWSAPAHFKYNNQLTGFGVGNYLRTDYYRAWAQYFLKFLAAYKQNNVSMWAITTQNEPNEGQVPFFFFNSMGWLPTAHGNWIANDLGPVLFNSEFRDVKMIILDDQTGLIGWAEIVLSNSGTANYVDGVGLHWYFDAVVPVDILNLFHNRHPDLLLLSTEACEGFLSPTPVILGSWERAENYAESILEDLNHYVNGWIDWNMALDMKGKPNWAGLSADSPVIVDAANDRVFKQPMFYALAHFTKFIPRDSIRISVRQSSDSSSLQTTAVLRPDGGVATVLVNKGDEPLSVKVCDGERGSSSLTLPPRSIQTLLYW